jgi:hypothetical protein
MPSLSSTRPKTSALPLREVREHIPRGAALLDRSSLYPRETLAGTVKSVRLVDAIIMLGKHVRDTHRSPGDQRVDLDWAQREIAELAQERDVAVLIRTRTGRLSCIEQCHRTDRQGRRDEDVLVHLDDDIVLGADWLDAVLRQLDLGADACGSIEDRSGDRMISAQRTLRIVPHEGPAGPCPVWRWEWHEPSGTAGGEIVDFAGQRALAVRAVAAKQIRHDRSLIAGDDVAYSLALREAGFRLHVANDTVITHRTLGEPDIAGHRTPDAVISSWRSFHRRGGFVRDTAAAKIGMSLDQSIALFTGPTTAGDGRDDMGVDPVGI